jgi:phosphate starvation-inducible PhoH-like protein
MYMTKSRSRILDDDEFKPTVPVKRSRYATKVPPNVQSPKPFHIEPKTDNQGFLLEAIHKNPITVALGCAGTGKTYCSAMKAAQLFLKGGYDEIVLSRSIIPTGKSMGFLPGDVSEKMIPWLLPIISVLEKGFGKAKYDMLFHSGKITIQPLETIRGRSFERAIMLVDEAQNLDFEELKAITTRIGEGSKMVLMGDTFQSDIRGESALLKFCNMCERHGVVVPVIQFGINDIVRSDIVASLVKMFMHEAGHR